VCGLLFATVTGCGGGGGSDRGDVVRGLADTVAIPMYQQLADVSARLHEAALQLCAAPSQAGVDSARQLLGQTRAAWRESEAMWVGPVMDRRSWSLIDWPVVADDVEALVDPDGGAPLDAQYLRTSVSASVRGLGAIEHVLYAGNGTAARLDDPRRCAYLQGLTQVVADEAATVRSLWTSGDDEGVPFRDELAGATDRMSATDSIDAIVNGMLSRLEGSVNRELGRALGSGPVDGDTSGIVEGPGGFGVADQRARVQGIRLVLIGPDGSSGLAPLLDDDLRDRLTTQLDAADAALARIDPPLVAAVDGQRAAVQAAHDALAQLRVTVSTELVSELGVTVSFSDADGDSSG
jgi:predicted lipoprotein